VAQNVAEGFRRLGQNPQVVNITATEGQFLNWQGKFMVSDNNFHQAVLLGDKIYDAYTGSGGMPWPQYQEQMMHLGDLVYTVVTR
jgi:hypothetical protein